MKPLARSALPLLAAVLLAGCGEDPGERFERARQAFAAEDYNAARIDLASALREEPGNRAMLLLLARAQLGLGDAAGALASIAKLRAAGMSGEELALVEAEARLLDGKPAEALSLLGATSSPAAWRLRAAALLDSGDPVRALSAFHKGLAAGSDPRLIADYGWFLLSANDIPGATAQAEALRRIAPQGYQALMLQARIALRTGQSAQALKLADEAARRFPTRFEVPLLRAEALEALGRAPAAAEAVARAHELSPENPKVFDMQMRIAAVRGQWAEVRKGLQSVEEELDPQSPEGMLYAEALLRIGYAEQARQILQRTVLLQPGNAFARRLLAEAQLAGNDPAGAVEALAPVAGDFMTGPEELAILDVAAGKAGSPDAERYRALRSDPGIARRAQLIARGETALQQADWADAIAAYRDLSAIAANAYVLANLAYAEAKGGDAAAAQDHARQALAIEPGNAAALKAGAVAMLANGDRAGAQDLLLRLLAQAPGDLEAVALLDKAQGSI